ncbi:MAG: uracil-DNA glycosylase [Verrucomicrobia bacterium]|nr:uracil-DNA glycosylase [Verrucomicrobiota bacterium]
MSIHFPPDILADTIQHLEQQRSRGVRFLRLDASLLQDTPGSVRPPISTASLANRRPPSPVSAPALQATTPQPCRKPAMTPEKREAFEALKTRALACQKCPHLVRFRKQVVFGVGDPNAELMFVGEAPGADEDMQGEPFVGKAGQLLTKMIETMELARSDVYIANVLKCRPDVTTATGNRKPTPEEMATCIPYLKEQIHIIQPRVLVALGDTAVKGLQPSLKDGISLLRGHWLEFEGIPLMPTFHPAYLLRNQSLAIKRLCWEDLLAVLERLRKPISEKQRNYFLSALSGRASN